MVMRLESRLRAFAALTRRGSFSGAASDLRISQPAISKHLNDLERELDVQLVDRRSKRLTAAGQFLANHVLRAEALLAQATYGVASLRNPGEGSLAVQASGTPGTYILPEIVAAFRQKHPGIEVKFELSTSAGVVQALRDHRAELGVVGGFVAAPEIDAEPLVQDEIVLVGAPRLKGKRLTRDALEEMIWISREEGSATRVIADGALAELGIVPQHRLALPSWEAIKLAVRRGSGLAACSKFAVADELAAGSLIEIRFVPWKLRRMFSIIRIRDGVLTPAASQFVEMLKAHVSAKRVSSVKKRS